MKKQVTISKKKVNEHQKSRNKKNNIVIGIQIATVGIVLTMIFASIYGTTA